MNPEHDPGQHPNIDYFGDIHRSVTGKPYEKAQGERGPFVETLTNKIIADLADPSKAEAARRSLRELIDKTYVGRM